MMPAKKFVRIISVTIILISTAACLLYCGNDNGPIVSTPPAIPETGSYIGGILLEGQTTIDEFNASLGVKHSVFGAFLLFPDLLDTSGSEYLKLTSFIAACKSANAIPMLTIETAGGLDSYSSAQVSELATLLYRLDISLFLRWDHEMNGSWYPWGQKPTIYIQKFQEVANAMHSLAPNVAMVWTPNQGWGYPWAGGEYSASTSDADFPTLDTNHDGLFTDADDPYSPYYPGDTYVDWVGHSFYHWGNELELGYNQVPYANKWAEANGINNTVPNFHDIYAVGHSKPMMIAETSGFYDPANTKGGGAGEAAIKNGWIGEVYNLTSDTNPKINEVFPKIKLIVWFSELKYESEVNGDVDWRLNSNAEVISFYQTVVADPYFIKAN